MIKFISLSMRNFISFGNNTTVVDLDRSGTTLIVGEDLDNTSAGEGANGVGKTTLINALAYGVYDKAVSNISKDNLVNNINKKNMEVTVTFEKNGTFYLIRRVRKSKAGAYGNYVELFKKDGNTDFNADDEITRDSVSNTNKLIESIIGIPYDLFVRIVVFSATLIPFLDLPVRHATSANQTDIIEELFDLTTLSEKADKLKLQIKDKEVELNTKKIIIKQLEREHLRHTEQIESAKRRVISWQTQNQESLKDIEDKLKRIAGVDIEHQRELHIELENKEEQLNVALNEQRQIEQVIKKLTKTSKIKEEELNHLRDAKCPYCLQEYQNAQTKIIECEQFIESSTNEIDSLAAELIDVDATVELVAQQHKKIKQNITVQNFEELLDIKNESASLQEKIEELTNAINPFIESLDELEAYELDDIGYDEINIITKHIEHQKFLLKLLTKKDSFVRKALLNKNIPFLNSRLQQYLNDLGLPHKVEFTHQLTAEISQFSRQMDFGNLSNGQRARVNIALSFAFRDVLQNLHDRINVCLLDEVLDVGLDTIGVQAAARMLKHKARKEKLSLYIISHRDEIDSAFDNKMIVQMTKGFSYIKEE